MTVEVATRASELPARPFTRDAAETMIRLYAIKAIADPTYEAQYARMLGVALWLDVDTEVFGEIVWDMRRERDIMGGADLTSMFGEPEPEDERSEDERRGDWAIYYADATAFSIGVLLDPAGY